MIDFLKSLDIFSGAFVVTFITVTLLVIWNFLLKKRLLWSMAIILPWPISYVLYWLPVWLGANVTEYWSWELLFVGAWSLISVFVSLIFSVIIKNMKN